jgi:hypothetical protein
MCRNECLDQKLGAQKSFCWQNLQCLQFSAARGQCYINILRKMARKRPRVFFNDFSSSFWLDSSLSKRRTSCMHRNLKTRTSIFALLQQKLCGKSLCKTLADLLHRQGTLLQRNNFTGVYLCSKPLFTSQNRMEISWKKKLFSNMLLLALLLGFLWLYLCLQLIVYLAHFNMPDVAKP